VRSTPISVWTTLKPHVGIRYRYQQIEVHRRARECAESECRKHNTLIAWPDHIPPEICKSPQSLHNHKTPALSASDGARRTDPRHLRHSHGGWNTQTAKRATDWRRRRLPPQSRGLQRYDWRFLTTSVAGETSSLPIQTPHPCEMPLVGQGGNSLSPKVLCSRRTGRAERCLYRSGHHILDLDKRCRG